MLAQAAGMSLRSGPTRDWKREFISNLLSCWGLYFFSASLFHELLRCVSLGIASERLGVSCGLGRALMKMLAETGFVATSLRMRYNALRCKGELRALCGEW